MASNPRKFSEKIALHNQKQAEETAAFEQIMKEVGSAKTPTHPTENGECNSSHSLLGIGSISTFRAGSLPNVNSPSTNTSSIDLQSALNNLEEMRSGRESGFRDRRSAGPGGGFNQQNRSSRQVDTSPRRLDHHPPSSPNHSYNNVHQIGSVGPPMGGSVSNSPSGTMALASSAYLSPPLDPSWRRTHSDSALHQATQLTQDSSLHTHGSCTSPAMSRRGQDGTTGFQGGGMSDPNSSANLSLGIGMDGRPKSCCDVSRVPGINICPGPEPNGIQIPIGNNTGSLPDLTNLQFSSPLPNPLDFEDPSSLPMHALYSTSPTMAGSPNLGGGSGFNNHLNMVNTVNLSLNPGHMSPRGSSPGPSPSTRRRPHHHLQNLVLGSSPRSHHGHSNQQQTQNHSSSPKHLAIPSIVVNSRLLHSSKGIALDPAGMSVPSFQPFYQQQQQQQRQQQQSPRGHGAGSDYIQSVSPAHSPTHMMSTAQPIPSHGQYLTTYRNAQPLLRPSPQSSPTLIVPGNMNYRSGSPGDGNCFNSAPPSPVSQSLSPASSPGLAPSPASPFTDQSSHLNGQLSASGSGNLSSNFPHNATNFLQQFEQITMMDTHSEQQQHHHNYGNYNKTNQFGQANMDLSLDTYYGQTSQLLFGTCGGTQQTAPQTPQTPSSIPDIVLQDFSSSTPEELARQGLSKDLSSAMGSSFDGVDFFPTDDALRDGLGPIDFNDLQMLASETSVVMDPSTEDHFRLDRL